LKLAFIICSLFFAQLSSAQLSVDWYKNSEELDIYSSKKSVYNPVDSCIYTTGMFSGQFEMDGVSITTTFPKAFFLMKYRRDGELVWLKTIAENDYNVELTSNVSLSADSAGSLILGITFNRKLFHGSDSIILPDDLTTSGGALFKLDTSGNEIWSKQVYVANIQAIAINESHTIFFTGTNTLGDAYLTAYSETGDSLWTKTGGSNSGSDEGLALCFDSNGNIYLGGRVEPNAAVYFDSQHPVFVSPYFSGCFLAKYNVLGEIEWIRCFYTSNFPKYIFYRSICVQNGKVVVAGSFEGGIAKFYPPAPALSSSSNLTTSFLICYDTTGALLWKKTPRKCLSGDEGLELGLFLNEGLIYSSSFSGSIVIGGDTLSSASNNLVIEAFDTLGNSIWHKQIFGANMDGATSFFKAEDDLVINISTKSTSLQIDNTTMALSPVSDQMVLVRFNVSTLGLDENETSYFSVFPNPTDGIWSLKTIHDVSGSNLQVFSISGELVYEQVLNPGNKQVVNTQLSSGVYLVRIAELSEKPIRLVIN
jgi:hypothetical protein